jgi:hypothetical protein
MSLRIGVVRGGPRHKPAIFVSRTGKKEFEEYCEDIEYELLRFVEVEGPMADLLAAVALVEGAGGGDITDQLDDLLTKVYRMGLKDQKREKK